MQRRIVQAVLVVCVFAAQQWARADAVTSGTGTLRLQFVDSRTGLAVRPSAVLIDGRQAASMPDQSGLLSLPGVTNGAHQVQVEAEKYQPFSATATVDGENSLVQTFEIDPVAGDDAATTPSATEAIIRGTVVDDLHGAAVAGAALKVTGVSTTWLSDDSGRFLVQFEAPAAERGSAPKVTLEVSREGYVAQECRGLDAARGSVQQLVVRLRRVDEADDAASSGPQVVNQGRGLGGNRNYQWTFDATLR